MNWIDVAWACLLLLTSVLTTDCQLITANFVSKHKELSFWGLGLGSILDFGLFQPATIFHSLHSDPTRVLTQCRPILGACASFSSRSIALLLLLFLNLCYISDNWLCLTGGKCFVKKLENVHSHGGKSAGMMTARDCASKCYGQNPDCVAIDYHRDVGECFLHSKSTDSGSALEWGTCCVRYVIVCNDSR